MKPPVDIAIVGATGAVGREFLRCLDLLKFPVRSLRLLASARSKGQTLPFRGKPVVVEELTLETAKGHQIALFSAGSGVSKEYAPIFAKAGAVVIDNSSAWRMDPSVPLVVPEVNPHDIPKHKGIIANPNCSTIQMVVALKPIHDAARITRVVVSTYQAVSGAGNKAVVEATEEAKAVLAGRPFERKLFPKQIAFNCIPQIPQKNAFEAGGYTNEEWKMVNETKKIMGDPDIKVSPTCVRVPVMNGHSESLNIETAKKITADQARDLLRKFPGVVVMDDPANQVYPTAVETSGRGEVFVGRIREDWTVPNGLHLWVVSDNLLKGAAYNAVQIALKLLD